MVIKQTKKKNSAVKDKSQNKPLGLRIQIARKEAGLKQNEFAKKLNVTNATLSRWESGIVTPEIGKLNTIAKLTGKSISYFFGEEQQPANSMYSQMMDMQKQISELKEALEENKKYTKK